MSTFVFGHHVNQGYYRAFIPEHINRAWQVDDMELLSMLSAADRHLGRLDMYSEYVNIDLYVRMHITKEATQSSRIEGTQTKMEEALMQREQVTPERRDDWEEVQNYIRAMQHAMSLMEGLPFSSRLIRETHKVLMEGVRGQHKQPGDFRKSQNWIGGATVNDAVFVPPPHHLVADLMSDLEKFANQSAHPMPELLKIALIHYQFETIHPFLDGNGRVGRLLITLYLVSQGILRQPVLYLSDFFERHRQLYYDNLMRVRTHNDINQWYKFFLVGITEMAKNGVKTFEGIFQLQNNLNQRLDGFGSRIVDAKKVMEQLFINPITDVKQVAKIIAKSDVSAYKLLNDLKKRGLLRESRGAKRSKMFVFDEYLKLFE